MVFTHQTSTEIITTRHVKIPDDLEDVTSSRECYLQILSMTIVAAREQKENNGEDNDSITHLRTESSRMETRLIELCGQTFTDIKNGSKEAMDELFHNADFSQKEDDEIMSSDDNEKNPSPGTAPKDKTLSYSSAVTNSKKMIRIRLSFRGQQKQSGVSERANETRRICSALLNGICYFDEGSKLTTWTDFGPEVGIQDLKILTDETTNKIFDIPKAGPLKGDVHSIGIRIITNLTPNEFTRNWNKYRWKASQANLIRLREAESQGPNKAYAIGYIQGTTPNGDYTTMKKEIEHTTDNKAEASWQMFNIPNVWAKMWNVAKTEARNAVGDDRSPEFKRKKFALSPEGLTIYVTKYEDIKSVKKHLIDKYGRRTTFNDGSVARFIPYVHGRVKDRKVIDNKLFTIVKTHCTTKAAEISIPIDVQDIHDTKEYLGGKSLEQLIHGLTDSNGEKIFNHIGFRWSTEYNSKSYIITACESRIDEAQRAVDDLKNILHNLSNPPEKIFAHFMDAQKGLLDSDTFKRRREEAILEDEDAQTYYAREDDCGQEERSKLPPYVMHIVLNDKENDDASSMGFSNMTKSVASNRKGILKRSNLGNSDEDESLDSINTSYTNKSGATSRSVKFDLPQVCDIMEAALLLKGVSKERFRAWKEDNGQELEFILKLHTTTAHRVRGIRKMLTKWTGTAAAGRPSRDS